MRRLLCLLLLTLAMPVQAEQVLRRGNGGDVEGLDPHRIESVSASDVVRDLYEGLLRDGPDGRPEPGVATRWEVLDEGLRYRFHLRADARWSNGDPVTAADFVAGLRRSVDPATGSNYSQMLSPLRNADAVIAGAKPPEALGAIAVDEHTLDIVLRAPTPYLLGLLTHSSASPVHRPTVAAWGKDFARAGRMVSNGAYRLHDWVLQSHIELERNAYYWDDAATSIDRVFYLSTEDIDSEFKRYRAGELDITYTLPSSQSAWVRMHLQDELRIHPYLGVYYYGLNLARPPLRDNPKLRLALALAVDRDIITGKVLGNGEVPAYTWVPPGVEGHRSAVPEWAHWTREQRLDRARALYAEAGFGPDNPAEVEILYNTQEDHRKIATVIAAMWKQWLGAKATLRNQEWKVYLQTRRLGVDTQVYRAGWIGDYNDPNTFMEILHSGHGLNDVGYDNPAFDALLDDASREIDPVRRAHLMHQAEAMIIDDLPVLPLYFYVTKHLVKPWVKGWVGNIMDRHPTRMLSVEGRPQ